jgi:16S rRNA (cytosine967-C5)-methyltransferase
VTQIQTEAPDIEDAQPAGLAARRAAMKTLVAILDRHQSLDDALNQNNTLKGMPANDRAFARLLVNTVLRRLPEIDLAFQKFLSRPLPRNPKELSQLLRTGTAQLLFLNTPPHAVVDTSVTLANEFQNKKFKGLVNAILRKVATIKSKPENPAKLNTPDWLWQSWVDQYGEEEATAIGLQHLAHPPIDISAKEDPAFWAKSMNAELLPTGTIRRTARGRPSEWTGFKEGRWWIQDAAAALPVKLLGPIAGKTVIDLCAAPGGKTAQLVNSGAAVTAVDISKNRISRLESNLSRLQLPANTIVADLRDWRPNDLADIVLLDAPCTATGTCRRHPDILRLRNESDVVKLSAVQSSLLDAAAEMTMPGGSLLYVTCSLQPEEGTNQISSFLDRHSNYQRTQFDMSAYATLESTISDDGSLRTLPSHWANHGGMDGFFAVALTRVL